MTVIIIGFGGCGGSSSHPTSDSGCPITIAPDAAAPVAHDLAMTTPSADMAPPPMTAAGPFTIAVIPDTQYLFDEDRGNASVLQASLQWIVDHTVDHNIVFTAHLGDLTENHELSELAGVDQVFRLFDTKQIPYSTVAGNHDLTNSSQDDGSRGTEPYQTYFSPARFATQPTYGGASTNGWNTYHIIDVGGGLQILMLSLDWRMSTASIAWAESILAANPTLPAILTMHELVVDNGGGAAVLSAYGQTLWDNLINTHDQIFLSINGHYWPPARTILTNSAGHSVFAHVADYQDRYYGGSGMIRLYQFDIANGTIDVTTFSPWLQGMASLNPLQQIEVEQRDDRNRFRVDVDFTDRFRGFRGPSLPTPAPVPAAQEVIPNTVAYWRFDTGVDGVPVPATGVVAPDLSGNGNDLTRVTLAGGTDASLVWSSDYHPSQPSRGGLRFYGTKSNPAFGGAYLRTADNAPLNAMTFPNGYTIEAFVKLPTGCCANNAWMGLLSTSAVGADVGKTSDDPLEPLATIPLSPESFVQWALYPTNVDATLTNWSQAIYDQWTHIAVVNDGQKTTMYTEGYPILRNPAAESTGIAANGTYWTIGAANYNHVIDQSFSGELGDVRIVARALTPAEFMIAR